MAHEGAAPGVGQRRQHPRPRQNAFGNPACFRIALASGLPSMLTGTVNVRRVIGLY